MKTLNLFAFKRNLDRNEGRGPMEIVGFTEHRDDALRIIKTPTFYQKYGVQGQPGSEHDVEEMTIKIYAGQIDYLMESKDARVKDALAKLTKEDKELLGLQ